MPLINPSGRGLGEGGKDANGGGLASSIWPQEAEELSPSDLKIQVIYYLLPRVLLLQARYLDHTAHIYLNYIDRIY
jgi:hypothetical protein